MHPFPELFARVWMAIVLTALGLAQILRPGWFYDIALFACRARGLSPQDQERLERVLDARARAEGTSRGSVRWLGLAAIVVAPFELVRGIQFAIPYALYCLATCASVLVRYAQIRRSTERRAAPLVARRPWESLSVGSVLATAGCLSAAVIYSIDPRFRVGGIAVTLTIVVLGWVAWRLANTQAVMFGEDPQLEYAVDTRLRRMRVNTALTLAGAPAVLLIGMTSSWMSPGYAVYGTVAFYLSYVSFFGMALISFLDTRSDKKMLNHA